MVPLPPFTLFLTCNKQVGEYNKPNVISFGTTHGCKLTHNFRNKNIRRHYTTTRTYEDLVAFLLSFLACSSRWHFLYLVIDAACVFTTAELGSTTEPTTWCTPIMSSGMSKQAAIIGLYSLVHYAWPTTGIIILWSRGMLLWI